jgi:hypothetical protein
MAHDSTISRPAWEEPFRRSNPTASAPQCERIDREFAVSQIVEMLTRLGASQIRDFAGVTDWLVSNGSHVQNLSLYDDACDLFHIASVTGIKLGEWVMVLSDVGRGAFGEALKFRSSDIDKRVLDAIWFQQDFILLDPSGEWLLDFDYDGLVTAWNASSQPADQRFGS